ncbi:hypothetical protein CMO96_03010 [Candidatus Woesebacteria bacterium]|nr:hypothetical protein [Candidatus Woesebacteria bacterium]|tara:strand:+ start:211 stop:471 length:261 start_codon:yes stop_codon:yes gene_type:complete
MYKAVFLDWHNTLSTSKFLEHLEDGSVQDRELFQRIEKSLFGKFRHLLEPWMLGQLASENITKKISKDTGLDKNSIFKAFVKSCKT